MRRKEEYKCPQCGFTRYGRVATKNGKVPFIYKSWRHCRSVMRPTGNIMTFKTFADIEREAHKKFLAAEAAEEARDEQAINESLLRHEWDKVVCAN